MCSIMGYCGKDIAKEKFNECFEKTFSRVPDMSRIVDT